MSAPEPIVNSSRLPAEDRPQGEVYSMYRKLIMSLAPVLAVGAFVVIPSAAQALPKWEHCVEMKGTGKFTEHQCATLAKPAGSGNWEKVVIPETTATSQTKEQLKTHGVLTLTDETVGGAAGKVEVVCQVNDKGVAWNEKNAGGVLRGRDEVTQFAATGCTGRIKGELCTAASVATEALPWQSELIEEAGVIRDKITGIRVTVTLTAWPGIGTATLTYTGELKPKIVNGNPTIAEFNEESGSLTSNDGTAGKIKGNDVLEQENGWAIFVHS
jgi:hypothetical protein